MMLLTQMQGMWQVQQQFQQTMQQQIELLKDLQTNLFNMQVQHQQLQVQLQQMGKMLLKSEEVSFDFPLFLYPRYFPTSIIHAP